MFGQSKLTIFLQQDLPENVPFISAEALHTIQNKDSLQLLDIRKTEEYKISHLKNAVLVNYPDFSLQKFTKAFPNKNLPIVVYCSVGIRSGKIGEKLQKAGYKKVKNLYGGIFKWKAKNYPVYDIENKETQKVHAYNKKWGEYLTNAIKVY